MKPSAVSSNASFNSVPTTPVHDGASADDLRLELGEPSAATMLLLEDNGDDDDSKGEGPGVNEAEV